MSEKPDPSSQTQEPTLAKLESARKKGDVPQSREVGTMMTILSLVALVAYVLPMTALKATDTLANVIGLSGQFSAGTNEAGIAELGDVLADFVDSLLGLLIPVFAVMLVGAIIGVALQGQTVFSAERITPKMSKISPLKGLARLFSKNTVVEFLKNITKVLAVGTLASVISYRAVDQVWQGQGILPQTLPEYISVTALKLLVAVAIFLVPIAIIDILWQRFQWKKKQMMTFQEIKDEFKDSEGDPHFKGKRAAMRRDRTKKQLVQIIPEASVIITNPTHFAIALKYDRNVDVAPVCIAKGADQTALRIRRLAQEVDIPLIENKLLARTLYASTEVDQYIREEHWRAVAEIIGYIEDLQTKKRTGPPNRWPD